MFVGGWTLDAAEAVCDLGDEAQALRHLSALVDKSLVQQTNSHDEPRFTMLETVREYALERLEQNGEMGRSRRRHAGFSCGLRRRKSGRRGGRCRGHGWTVSRQSTTICALPWTWSLGPAGDTETGLRLTGALSHFWYMREHHSESRTWLESAGAERRHRTRQATRRRRAAGLVPGRARSVPHAGKGEPCSIPCVER